MPRLTWLPWCAVALGALTGCGTEPVTCTEEVLPAVVVDIRDAFDDVPIAEAARGAVQDGAFLDSLRPFGAVGNGTLVSRAAADERAGEYTVTIEHDGYLPWETTVRVGRNACHVETVKVSVYLTAVP